MKKYRCLTGNSKQTINKFLSLPSSIYVVDKFCPQDYKTEKAILTQTHVLSQSFTVYPFVMVDENDNPISRCLLTYYNNDPVAYLGFFESFNHRAVVRDMFLHVEQKVRKDGKTKIVGPIDSSIYINYRFKTSKFDETYTGEPYNKPYYPELWAEAGFVVDAEYVSYKTRQVTENDFNPKLERIYNRYLERGYQFITPTDETFRKCLRDVYSVMMESYSDFAGFKKLTELQFIELFSDLQKIVNYEMVHLAYKDNKLHAFSIALPNYGDLTKGKISLTDMMKINKIKKQPNEYVVLYIGADKTPGLGTAIMHHLRNTLYQNQCLSILALIKDGNLTGELYDNLHYDKFEYVLMSKTM